MKNLLEEQTKRSALGLFSKKGFQNTTVAEIAESAGLSKGLIYWYWDSKEKIAFSLVREMLSEFLKTIENARDRDGSFIA
ncbi:MAG: helix-turn-helix domain-containing protein [Actinomycetota bacterium]|nr:helix-turn-helix domain-containing protein [Actinomycetota bacterium]